MMVTEDEITTALQANSIPEEYYKEGTEIIKNRMERHGGTLQEAIDFLKSWIARVE